MTARHIWVADPGKTTGLVTYDRVRDKFCAYELGFNEVCTMLISDLPLLHMHDSGAILAAERFIITQQTPKNTQAPWSLELIGVCRMISRLYLEQELVMQDAASAKRFSSDTRLRRLGWYTPAKGHANDAARHLLLLMATRGMLPEELMHEFAELA